MVFIAGKLCDPCLSALKWFVYHARHYTSARLYLFTFIVSDALEKAAEKSFSRRPSEFIYG